MLGQQGIQRNPQHQTNRDTGKDFCRRTGAFLFRHRVGGHHKRHGKEHGVCQGRQNAENQHRVEHIRCGINQV